MKAYNPITVANFLNNAKNLILRNQNNWLDKDKELLTKRFCVSGELAV